MDLLLQFLLNLLKSDRYPRSETFHLMTYLSEEKRFLYFGVPWRHTRCNPRYHGICFLRYFMPSPRCGGKGGRCAGLTTLPPSCAGCLNILGVSDSWSSQGLYRPVHGQVYLTNRKASLRLIFAVLLSVKTAGAAVFTPPGKIPGTHLCWRLSRPQDHSAAGRINSMENSSDSTWNFVVFSCTL